MRKLFILLVVLSLASISMKSNAQVFEGPAKGESILGVRFGAVSGLGANVSYDYALARVWKGTFTIGGYVGYHHHSIWNAIPIMLRTTYRLSVLTPEWEVYGGVMMGAGINFLGNNIMVIDLNDETLNPWGSFAGDFVLGSSYYFTKNIGVNLEFALGRPSTWVNIGFNFKF